MSRKSWVTWIAGFHLGREMNRYLTLSTLQLTYQPWIVGTAPFYKLFQHTRLAKDTESGGKYDWAHIAYTLWPERVRAACHQDNCARFESLYVKPAGKGKKARKNVYRPGGD